MSEMSPGLRARLDQGRAAHGAISDMVLAHYLTLVGGGMSRTGAEQQALTLLNHLYGILAADAEWNRTKGMRSQVLDALLSKKSPGDQV